MDSIGFIGAGNMAQALIRGILEAKLFAPGRVFISDVRKERLAELAGEYGIQPRESNADLARECSIVVLSVKPQQMDEVLGGLSGVTMDGKCMVSIAAGVRCEKISTHFPSLPMIRVMPNTPALVGKGMSALFSANADENVMARIREIFESVGRVIVVGREELMDSVTAVSGSGPAYFFLMMEAMIEAGISLGLSAEQAGELVLQTALGGAELAVAGSRSGQTPAALREKVTSPGGTTAAALQVFGNKGFSEMVLEALTAARDRSVELSG